MKFLVIGLGSIGTKHANNLKVLGHDVVAHDPDKNLVADLRDKFDACIIAAPTPLHAGYLHMAIERGEHVFMEKPLADKISQELEDDLEYADDTHILVALGNNLRFHPSCRLVRRYIMEGIIGNPIWASIVCAQYNERPQYRRDGVSLNWGAHELDLALWLLGPAQVAAASIDKDDTIADICLAHESGCRSVVHLDYLTEPEMRQTVIVGDLGRMVVSLTGRYVALQRGARGRPPEQQDGSWDDDYRNEMIAFVGAIQGDRSWPGATGEDGLATLKLINDAQKMAGLK